MTQELTTIGPPATIVVVFIFMNAEPVVVDMSTSIIATLSRLNIRAHAAVPSASAAESCVIAAKVSALVATVPTVDVHVTVPSSVCVVIAVSGPAGLVAVYSLMYGAATADPAARSFRMAVSTLFAVVSRSVIIMADFLTLVYAQSAGVHC